MRTPYLNAYILHANMGACASNLKLGYDPLTRSSDDGWVWPQSPWPGRLDSAQTNPNRRSSADAQDEGPLFADICSDVCERFETSVEHINLMVCRDDDNDGRLVCAKFKLQKQNMLLHVIIAKCACNDTMKLANIIANTWLPGSSYVVVVNQTSKQMNALLHPCVLGAIDALLLRCQEQEQEQDHVVIVSEDGLQVENCCVSLVDGYRGVFFAQKRLMFHHHPSPMSSSLVYNQ